MAGKGDDSEINWVDNDEEGDEDDHLEELLDEEEGNYDVDYATGGEIHRRDAESTGIDLKSTGFVPLLDWRSSANQQQKKNLNHQNHNGESNQKEIKSNSNYYEDSETGRTSVSIANKDYAGGAGARNNNIGDSSMEVCNYKVQSVDKGQDGQAPAKGAILGEFGATDGKCLSRFSDAKRGDMQSTINGPQDPLETVILRLAPSTEGDPLCVT